MTKFIKKIFIITFLFVSVIFETNATHMVGGDFTYKSLGNGYFEITLTLRRDCEFGAADAQFDTKATIAVFNQEGSIMKHIGVRGGFLLDYIGSDTLYESINVECGILGSLVCVHESVYRQVVFLPRPNKGNKLILVYQRCCRNQTILNITDPLDTGGSYYFEIDQYAWDEANSAPKFKKWPPIYICANQQLNFDHSAVDIDGDSLVYRLHTPFSGASDQYPMPTLENTGRYTSFYDTINWSAGYSLDNIFGGTDPLRIDPKTGLLTGTPVKVGQFLVGVTVEEYRNGFLISRISRDFEFNVRPCVPPPFPFFESVEAICGSGEMDTLRLINASTDADSYTWSVYVHSLNQTFTFTSTDLDYIYTLPAYGKDTFDISLEAYNMIADCSNTYTKRIIAVGAPMNVDFDYSIIECYDDKLVINLVDKFKENNPLYVFERNKWTLTFENEIIEGTGENIDIDIPRDGKFTIKLEVWTEEPCYDFSEKFVDYDIPDIKFISIPVVLCEGDSSKFVANPNSDWTYTWSPEEGLLFDGDDKSDPLFIGLDDSRFYVTVTDGLCYHYDSVDIVVKDYFMISIEGPDTVCVDEVILKGVGVPDDEVGIAVLEWSTNAGFDPVIGTGPEITVKLEERVNKFYLRVRPGTGCSENIPEITIYNGTFELDYKKEFTYCYKNLTKIEVKNLTEETEVTFQWEENPLIIGDLDKSYVIIYTEEEGQYVLKFTAVSDLGCEYQGSITVNAVPEPFIELIKDFECYTYNMCFGVSSSTVSSYNWQITNADNEIITFTSSDPCYDFGQPGIYKLYLEIIDEQCDGIIIFDEEIEIPEIIELTIESEEIVYCENESIELSAVVNVESTISWYNSTGDLIGVGENIEYNPVGDDIITVIAIDKYDCSDTATLSLIEYKFDLEFTQPDVACFGDTLILEVKSNKEANLKYEWSGINIISDTTNNIVTVIVFENTTFTVIVTDLDFGCERVINIDVTVSDIDITLISDKTEIVINNSFELEVINVPPNSQIFWSTGERDVNKITVTPTFTVDNVFKEEREYCVTVIDQYGCEDTDCVLMTVIDPPCNEEDIYFPNAFSPNADGVNDVFRPRGLYIRNIDMMIFNRWGELLFDGSGDDNLSWDGTYKGKLLTPDTYTFRIFLQCDDNDNYEKIGNVSLIK